MSTSGIGIVIVWVDAHFLLILCQRTKKYLPFAINYDTASLGVDSLIT